MQAESLVFRILFLTPCLRGSIPSSKMCLVVLLISLVNGICAHLNPEYENIQAALPYPGSRQITFVETPKIAIIGAGIGGASAAHHLHQLARIYFPLEITVFEKEPYIGGQILSTTLRHDPNRKDMELGASSFLDNDRCLVEAAREVGLRSRPRKTRISKRFGLWNGPHLLISGPYKAPDLESRWRSPLGRLVDRIRTSRLKGFFNRAISHIFLALGLTDKRAEEDFYNAQMLDPLRSADEHHLPALRTDSVAFHEMAKLSAQHPMMRKLDNVTGPAAAGTAKPMSIVEGNWRLPNRMLKISEAKVSSKSPVQQITHKGDGKWQVQVRESLGNQEDGMKTRTEDFDYVIITTPFEISDIELDPPSIGIPNRLSRAFKERHITYFTCKRRIAPTYFNQPTDSVLPEDIFISQDTSSENVLISVTVEDEVNEAMLSCVINYPYFLYKVTSTRAMSDEDIAALFGEENLAILTREEYRNIVLIREADMDWIHRQAWPHVGPANGGDSRPGGLEIAENLYYLPAGLQGQSTMEKSCRLGETVANMLFHGKLKEPEEMEP